MPHHAQSQRVVALLRQRDDGGFRRRRLEAHERGEPAARQVQVEQDDVEDVPRVLIQKIEAFAQILHHHQLAGGHPAVSLAVFLHLQQSLVQ